MTGEEWSFCGRIDDFAKRVEEEHRDDVHGKMYRLAIEMARVKAGSLSLGSGN